MIEISLRRKSTAALLLFSLRAGWDDVSALSIGQVLLMQIIRDACNEGVVSFDFLHGDAEYKRYWATNTSRVDRLMAGRGFRGYLIGMSYLAAGGN